MFDRRVRPLFAAMIALLGWTAMSVATPTPSTWVVFKLIGVNKDGWVAHRTIRQLSSYYAYDVQTDFIVVDPNSGCISKKVPIGQIAVSDPAADNSWQATANLADADTGAVIAQSYPVIPSGWQDYLKLEENGVTSTMESDTSPHVSRSQIIQWAALQGIDDWEELRIANAFAPIGGAIEPTLIYVELESTYRDIDTDYVRFIVPVHLDRTQQPVPTGC